MLQTLFVIPYEVGGVPLFGWGVLLAFWAVACAIGFTIAIRRRGLDGEVLGYFPIALMVGAVIFFLPRLFPTGLPIRGYGTMMLLGVVSGIWLAMRRAKQAGVNPEIILTLAFWMFITGIVGARLFYVIEYWDEYRRNHPDLGDRLLAMLNVSEGGLVVYGSFIAVMAAVVIFVRKYRVPGLALVDLITPSMLLGLAFGRIGCLMNGCCFGGTCELPWSVEFPWGSPPHVRQVEQGRLPLHGIWLTGKEDEPAVVAKIEPGSAAEKGGLAAGDRILSIAGRFEEFGQTGQPEIQRLHNEIKTIGDARLALLKIKGDGATLTVETLATGASRPKIAEWTLAPPTRSLPVHPAQVYSSIDALLICLFLVAYTPYRRRDGEIIGLTLVIYPIARFLEETVRIDEFAVFGTGLSISQNISLLVFAAGVVVWCFILTRPKKLAFGPAAAS